jgi:antitoxin component YwqK of YwqJK toxin-antitoxin module
MIVRPIFILFTFLCACAQAPSPETSESVTEPEVKDTIATNGMHEIRDKAGNLIMRGEKIDGKREGGWESFFPDGTLRSRGTFVNDVQQGPTTVYHPNGAVFYTGWFKDGKPVSDWLFFNEKGEQVKIVKYSAEGIMLEQKEF